MGHDCLKESQDVSEDSRVLLGLVKWEPAEKRPGSLLPIEKKEFLARFAKIGILVQPGWECKLEEGSGCPPSLGSGSQL